MAFSAKWGNERMCSVSVIAKVLVQMPDGTFDYLPLAEYREEKCGKCENKGEAFLCGREAGFQ